MTHTASKTNRTAELLNDLLRINNDRIASYQLALDQSSNMDGAFRAELKKIIYEATNYKDQLTQKIWELEGNPKTGTTVLGKFYRAWMDLKVTFAGNTQKSILSSCMYNEEIALHTYDAALNQDADMNAGIKHTIEEQEQGLRNTYRLLGKYRETRYVAERSVMYFN